MIQPVSWAPHGSKEGVRLILASTTVEQARTAKARFDAWATAAGANETTRLAAPITAWWPHIEVTITTSVTRTLVPKPRTPPSNTSNAPAAATATTPTTKPVPCSEAPTGSGNTA